MMDDLIIEALQVGFLDLMFPARPKTCGHETEVLDSMLYGEGFFLLFLCHCQSRFKNANTWCYNIRLQRKKFYNMMSISTELILRELSISIFINIPAYIRYATLP
jgi:hypothetical protein